jgi:hypothetical protein
MKQKKEKDTFEENSKSKESGEYWVNPEYKAVQNVPNKIIIEDKNPFFIENNSEGKKTYGEAKKSKKLFEYADKINTASNSTSNRFNKKDLKRKNEDSSNQKNKKHKK